ncbi:MAG: hypothetical protein H0V17_27840 [Deltaproteobacteria bacterium]|nr:hypothetical protein [Deltaproteobacteria bacterium]
MSAVCPACGVAIVPGYAKCPKCHKPLLYGGGRRAAPLAGGTVADDRRFPIALIAVPLGAMIFIVLLLKTCSGGDEVTPETTVQPTQPATQVSGTAPAIEAPIEPGPIAQPTPQAFDPSVAIGELDRVLRGRRFWSSIDVARPRVDIRSASCDDPAMGPTIDGVAPTLRGAGLTRLRCLAQSGTVVFERDL